MTVALTNGDGQLRIPADAWSGAPVGDWLVAKVDPRPAGAVSPGFAAQGDVYDVSAYWALAGGAVTSFDDAIDLVKAAGGRSIALVCVICAPEGIALLQRTHSDVDIYTPVVDRELNAHKFIVPGLGDFGDRLYGT